MTKNKKKTEAETATQGDKEKLLNEKVDAVVNHMFGDYGPFGWNDKCNLQDIFNRCPETTKIVFVEKVTAKIKARLLEYV